MIRFNFHRLWNILIRKIFFWYKRQKYHMCHIGNDITQDEFMKTLIPLGYQFNYFSLRDKGEIANVRKLYITNNGDNNKKDNLNICIRQIHVRLYSDGEIRAHDELSYEEDMINHIREISIRPIEIEEKTLIIEKLKNRKKD